MNDLLVEISETPHTRIPEIEIDENRVYGCTSKVWIAKISHSLVGCSESAFVNGVVQYLLSSGSIDELEPLLTHQRRNGAKAILARIEDLR